MSLSIVPYDEIEKAFEANDSHAISLMGKDKVLFNILGKEGVYSQPQASLVLNDFFKRKPGASFKFFFKGKASSKVAAAASPCWSKTAGTWRSTSLRTLWARQRPRIQMDLRKLWTCASRLGAGLS